MHLTAGGLEVLCWQPEAYDGVCVLLVGACWHALVLSRRFRRGAPTHRAMRAAANKNDRDAPPAVPGDVDAAAKAYARCGGGPGAGRQRTNPGSI